MPLIDNALWSDVFTENAAADGRCGAGADRHADGAAAALGVDVADDVFVLARGDHQPDA